MKTAISIGDRILDISVNLARIGNWTADSYEQKRELIHRFISQTNKYVKEVASLSLSEQVKPLFSRFQSEFQKLQDEKVTSENKDWWAERALTWANILQHRARLA